jgi:hypothetical protein
MWIWSYSLLPNGHNSYEHLLMMRLENTNRVTRVRVVFGPTPQLPLDSILVSCCLQSKLDF